MTYTNAPRDFKEVRLELVACNNCHRIWAVPRNNTSKLPICACGGTILVITQKSRLSVEFVQKYFLPAKFTLISD